MILNENLAGNQIKLNIGSKKRSMSVSSDGKPAANTLDIPKPKTAVAGMVDLKALFSSKFVRKTGDDGGPKESGKKSTTKSSQMTPG